MECRVCTHLSLRCWLRRERKDGLVVTALDGDSRELDSTCDSTTGYLWDRPPLLGASVSPSVKMGMIILPYLLGVCS